MATTHPDSTKHSSTQRPQFAQHLCRRNKPSYRSRSLYLCSKIQKKLKKSLTCANSSHYMDKPQRAPKQALSHFRSSACVIICTVKLAIRRSSLFFVCRLKQSGRLQKKLSGWLARMKTFMAVSQSKDYASGQEEDRFKLEGQLSF